MKAAFPLTAFTADIVSRLTNLSVRQLHEWDRAKFFHPSFADPDRRRPHSRVYSFADLVALRTIADLRRHGVSWPDLKRVRRYFASATNEDWTNRRFFVVGKRVFFSDGDAILAARPLGQRVETKVLELGPIVRDVEEAVRRLAQRTPEQFGQITRDRFIMNGAPVLAGTRIPTETVDWFAQNGYSDDDILREFPRLAPEDIRAAVAYEAARRSRTESAA